jgi:hypothetical protein
MEKVKIKTCVNSGKMWKEKPIIEIVLEDGRKGSAFDTAFLGLPLNQEVEIDMKPGKEYNGVMQYYFNIPGQNHGAKKGGTFQKDWTLEKRRIALETSVSWCSAIVGSVSQLKTTDVINCANAFFEWLNQKSE